MADAPFASAASAWLSASDAGAAAEGPSPSADAGPDAELPAACPAAFLAAAFFAARFRAAFDGAAVVASPAASCSGKFSTLTCVRGRNGHQAVHSVSQPIQQVAM